MHISKAMLKKQKATATLRKWKNSLNGVQRVMFQITSASCLIKHPQSQMEKGRHEQRLSISCSRDPRNRNPRSLGRWTCRSRTSRKSNRGSFCSVSRPPTNTASNKRERVHTMHLLTVLCVGILFWLCLVKFANRCLYTACVFFIQQMKFQKPPKHFLDMCIVSFI